MKYVYDHNINAVIPDTQFRQRDPRIAGSDTVAKHKAERQKTRKDKSKGTHYIPSSEFSFNESALICVCPAGHEMMYQGSEFLINNKKYHRFQSRLNHCRQCALQSKCMRNPVKEQGRQVSIIVGGDHNKNYMDLMKAKVDSEQGREDYVRRMWTVEPVFGNICSNHGINKLTLRGQAKLTCQWMICCMMHNVEKLWRYGDVIPKPA